ncbi:hypothetical protein AGMMS49975_22250 [Clostridia bacterium]|nr:hypothetical protein AGMMS49975_22250 [Clostridia bacterium]
MNGGKLTANELYEQISGTSLFASKYPMLYQYATPIKPMSRPLLGRDKELRQLRTGLLRPELCNVLLLGDAGSGNTALVQGAMKSNSERIYVEIDLSKMIADLRDPNEMATRIKQLFENSQLINKDSGMEIVLFMDEFHLVTMLSSAAVEALKPMLADSGTRGIRVVAATTFSEFTQYIAANQPLVQRLQRINITPPSADITVSILGSFAQQYGRGGAYSRNASI